MNFGANSPTLDPRSFDDPMSPTTLKYNEAEQFCSLDSLEASSNYINILLTTYNYPVPLVFNSRSPDDQCKIVNCLYALLQDRKNDALERQEFINTINDLKKQQGGLESTMVNLKRDNNTKDQLNKELRSKLETNELRMKKNSIQNTRLKEEISKLKNNMQYMKTQYANETSRHEQELAKAQDRIVKCMNHHYKAKQAMMETNSYLAANMHEDSNKVDQEHKKYAQVIQQANDREEELKLETEDLRTSLITLYTDVHRLLETQIIRFDQHPEAKPRDVYPETARLRLPKNCGGKEAIHMIQDLLARLKQEWDHQLDQTPQLYSHTDIAERDELIQCLQEELTDLTENFVRAREEHGQEVEMYKRFEQGGFFDTLYPTPKDAYISDSEDESKYDQLKKKAMRDQKKLTQSALELGKRRSELEAERWAFEEMKRAIQLQDILQESSSSTTTPPPPPPSAKQTFTFEPSDRPRKRKSGWLGAAPSNN
ncbi:hypothetical protein INT47_006771 [Mucor saturninus]|uniref:Afadin and alpha-actinin-binding-domain-containing protein n=1 Tax=Mucor saturninus TaxID=64648 RepID=A0A8H7R0U5_9FUNG|nr:hypothetical protein INT47_006771 [Mucor saturninus]